MRGWLFIALLCIGSLFSITGLRQFFVHPLPDVGPNVLWFAIQVAPLVVLLPGLLRSSVMSTFLICLASMLYFIHGIVVVYEGSLVILGSFEIFFATALCAVTAYIVRRLREAEANEVKEG